MITKTIGNKEFKITLEHMEQPENPRDDVENNFLCIRNHRRYNFRNELDFDFDEWDDEDNSLPHPDDLAEEKGLELFYLDCYEHGNILFSISGSGADRCKFDTTSEVGFMLAENKEIAELYIKEYNSYINGEVYEYIIEERTVAEIDGEKLTGDWDFVDGMCGVYNPSKDDYKFQDLFTKEEFEKIEVPY